MLGLSFSRSKMNCGKSRGLKISPVAELESVPGKKRVELPQVFSKLLSPWSRIEDVPVRISRDTKERTIGSRSCRHARLWLSEVSIQVISMDPKLNSVCTVENFWREHVGGLIYINRAHNK